MAGKAERSKGYWPARFWHGGISAQKKVVATGPVDCAHVLHCPSGNPVKEKSF